MAQATLTAVDFDPFADGGDLELTAASTEAQRELWTASRMGDDASCSFNEAVSLSLVGALDLEALRGALQDLVARHEALRTTFSADGATVCVARRVAVDVPLTDLSGLDAQRRDAERKRLMVREVETPFVLERGPLCRAHVLRLRADEHLLLFTAHHVVCDGWSMGVAMKELAALYTARRRGLASALPAAPRFSDYARVTGAREASPEHADDERWWLQQFAGTPPPLELPLDRSRPLARTFAADREDYVLPAPLVEAVERAGAKLGASFFTTTVAAFEALLHRLSGADDLVVAIPAAGQAVTGMLGLVGHCVNALPVRARVDGDESFAALLQRVRSTMLDAYEHQQYTFGTLLKKLPLPRDPSRLPLVSVMFNVDQGIEALAFEGLTSEFRATPRHFENFEIFVNAARAKGELVLQVQYNTDLFDRATVRRWMRSYELLLAAAAQRPETLVGALPVVDESERALVAGWNQTRRDYAREACVHDLTQAQAERTPDALALIAGDARLSYRELDERANQLARRLRELGVQRDGLVGLYVERSAEMLVAMLAVHKAGGAYVPLDPAFPAERLAFMVEDARLPVIVTSSKLEASLPRHAARVLVVDRDPGLATASRAPLTVRVATPESLAYVIYTSGSTGKPKGVEVPHGAVVNFLQSISVEPGLHAGERLLAVTTLSFDIAVLELFGPLVTGGTVVLASRETAGDGAALLRAIDEHRVDVMQATPATWRLMLAAGWQGRPGFRMVCGGEALPRDLALELTRRGTLWNMYGPTETTVWSTCWKVPSPLGRIVIGRPLANTQVHVLDARREPVPIGVIGELYIGGDGVTRGYHARPELTRERFVADPFTGGAGRLYRTGDLARWCTDGTLEFLGRNDGQVKVRGYRIELGEIEARLAEHAGVGQGVVVVREVRPGDARLVAYVVAKGEAPSDEALRVHLKRSLPDYMVPQHFVALAALPLTPNGKIDRKQLPAPIAAVGEGEGFVAPRDELEQKLASLFGDVLGVPRVGVHDDFFNLGGHSLLAAQLMSRLSHEHGVDLSLRRIFEAPTVARLADVARGGRRGEDKQLAKIPRLTEPSVAPLSLMQQRLYFLEQLDPGKPVYNLPSAFRFKGALDVAALERALDAFVARHPATRAVIEVRGGEPVQVVRREVRLELPRNDLRGSPAALREAELMRLLQREADTPFDLATGPLVRGSIYLLADDETVLYWMPHHLVWDGWSFDVFLRELDLLYAACARGEAAQLPALPITYNDFAAWQRGALEAGGDLDRQARYWKEQLGGELPILEMPTDKPRPSVMSFRGSTEPFVLTADEVAALERVARDGQATLYMVLLAAFKVLLHRTTQQEDLIVGTPIRGRSQPETEGLVGFFVNTLALRTRLEPQASFREVLRRVRATTLDAFSHQEMPFERIVTELGVPRDLSRTPVFQAFFTFQDVSNRGSSLGPVPYSQIHVHPKATPTDLSFWVKHSEGRGISGGIDFNTDVFEPATAVRFLKQLRTLLASLAKDPDQPIAALGILPESERRALLAVNDTTAEYPRQLTVHELVEAQCAASPEATAITAQGGALSYAELDRRANRIAHALREQGVREGVRVGLCVERTSDLVVGLLAVLKAGGAYVPLDPAFPRERLAFMLQDAEAPVVLTQRALTGELPPSRARVVLLDDASHETRPATPLPRDAAAASPESIAYVIYTSGSTGKPKGVQVPHRAVVNFLGSMRREPGLSRDDVLLAVTTLSFDIAVLELLLPLTVGARVVVAPREAVADGEQLVRLLDVERVTVMQATPSTWRLVLGNGFAERPAFKALCGGEAFPAELARELVGRVGSLWNMYGPTETTVWSTLWRVPPALARAPLIGRPIANTQVYVLDPRGELLPTGAMGELYIGGDGVTAGYLHRPELTAERFVADPFSASPAARLYRTGDVARLLADGNLEYVRRNDAQVKVRGYRIELGEIESVLGAHPALRQAVVVVREDRPGDARLVAYTVARPGEAVTDSELRKHLRRELPEYMIPQHFVELDALPATPNGKVDRKRLPAPFAAAPADDEYVAPRTPTEQRLASIWAETLRAARVGLHDNFFNLGGHSLLCLAVIARVERETGKRLSPRVMLRDSLGQIAAQLDATAGVAPAAAKTQEPGKEDPSLTQRVLGKLFGR